MKFDTILFDVDGVLVDSEDAMRTVSIKALKKYGITAIPTDFDPYVGMGENKFIGCVVEKYGKVYTMDIKKYVYDLYAAQPDGERLAMPGVKEMILSLKKQGFKVAIGSSADSVKVYANLRFMKLTKEDFDAVITGEAVSHNKPDPEVYLKAAECCGSDPEKCVVVEDATAGIRAAIAAGAFPVGRVDSFTREELFAAGAKAVIDNTVELAGVLEELNRE